MLSPNFPNALSLKAFREGRDTVPADLRAEYAEITELIEDINRWTSETDSRFGSLLSHHADAAASEAIARLLRQWVELVNTNAELAAAEVAA